MFDLDRSGFQEYLTPLKLQDGSHTLEAYAIDRAGNTGDRIHITLKVDSQPDKVEFSVSPSPTSGGWYDQKPSIKLTTSVGTEIMYSWEGMTPYSEYNGNLIPPVEEGVVALVYYSEDKAGNRGGQSRLSFSVDAKAPTARVNVTGKMAPGETVSFDMSGSTDGIGVVSYWIDFGDGTDPQWQESPTADHIYAGEGNYIVNVKVKDAAGHDSDAIDTAVNVEGSDSFGIVIAVAIGAGLLIVVVVVLGLMLLSHRSHGAHPVHHQHLSHHPAIHNHPQATHRHAAPAPRPVQPHRPQTSANVLPVPPKAPAAPSEYRIPEPPKPPQIPGPPHSSSK
jgi:PKD repeat protein